MKIRQLELKNFRCFDHKTFEFSDQFNVLIGDNGTGKSAILDALAISAGSLFLGIDDTSARNIRPDEVRQVRIQSGETPTSEKFYPVNIVSQGVVAEREIQWSRSLDSSSGRTTIKDARSIQEIGKELQDRARNGESVILPLISYYGTGRLWSQKKEKSIETLPPRARRYGYVDCLDPASNQKQLLKWMKTMEIASLQRGNEINVLSALKQSVSECMENWRSVFYDILEDDLMATSDNGKILPFRMLSDGVRNMLAMVADIAYRAATINLNSSPPSEYEGRSIEDIIEDIMGIELPQYSRRKLAMLNAAEDYYRVLEEAENLGQDKQEELNGLKQKLDELSMPFSDDPAYHAFLKMERLARGL